MTQSPTDEFHLHKSPRVFQEWLARKHPRAVVGLWTPHEVTLKTTVGMTLFSTWYSLTLPAVTVACLLFYQKMQKCSEGLLSSSTWLQFDGFSIYMGLYVSSLITPSGFWAETFPQTSTRIASWILEMASRYLGIITVFDDPDAFSECLNANSNTKRDKSDVSPMRRHPYKHTNRAIMGGVCPHDILPLGVLGTIAETGSFKCLLDSELNYLKKLGQQIEATKGEEEMETVGLMGKEERGGNEEESKAKAKLKEINYDSTLQSYQDFDPNFKRTDDQLIRSRGVVTGVLLKLPFSKHMAHMLTLRPVTSATIKKYLQEDTQVIIAPGGVQEVVVNYVDDRKPGDEEKPDVVYCYLQKRLGFIRLAMEANAAIVPAFLFGQDKMWSVTKVPTQLPLVGPVFKWISRKIGFTPLILWGRWFLPVGIPNPQRAAVVWGSPIIPKQDDTIESIHKEFCRQMKYLAESYGEGFGRPNLEAIIV